MPQLREAVRGPLPRQPRPAPEQAPHRPRQEDWRELRAEVAQAARAGSDLHAAPPAGVTLLRLTPR